MTKLFEGKGVWTWAAVAVLLVVVVLFSTQALSVGMNVTAQPIQNAGPGGAIEYSQDWSGASGVVTRHESTDLTLDVSNRATGVTVEGVKQADSCGVNATVDLLDSSATVLDTATASLPSASEAYSTPATLTLGTISYTTLAEVAVAYSLGAGSAQTTPYSYYLHSEDENVGGTNYYRTRGTGADGTATTISSVFAASQTGRVSPASNNGKFVYPFGCISSLPAEQWTSTYRVKRDDPGGGGDPIAFDAASFGNGTGATLTISHTVANQSNRVLTVDTMVEDGTAGNCAVSGITYNSVALTKIASNMSGSTVLQCVELWYLLAPEVGTFNIVITFGGAAAETTGGGISLYNVKQQAPEAFNSQGLDPATSITTLTDGAWLVDAVGSGNAIDTGFTALESGQTRRFEDGTTTSASAGGTRYIATAGAANMGWSQAANRMTHVVAAFAPMSSSTINMHPDMDIVVRKADGSLRATLATNVLNGNDISTSWESLTATYSFPGYTVVDSGDYLEFDLYAEATTNTASSAVTVDFRIDDNVLAGADQTKVATSATPSSPVTLLDAWVGDGTYTIQDLAFAPSAGSNRLVVIAVTAEKNAGGPLDVDQVSLGDAVLTEIGQQVVGDSGAYHNLVWLGYLNEAGIAGRTGDTITVTWTNAPNDPFGETKVAAVTYQYVNQTTPIADSSGAINTASATLQPGNVTVGERDQVVYGAVAGQPQTHTADTGYTEGFEFVGPSNDHSIAVASRDATTASTENPTVTWNASTRLGVVAAVLNGE